MQGTAKSFSNKFICYSEKVNQTISWEKYPILRSLDSFENWWIRHKPDEVSVLWKSLVGFLVVMEFLTVIIFFTDEQKSGIFIYFFNQTYEIIKVIHRGWNKVKFCYYTLIRAVVWYDMTNWIQFYITSRCYY